MNGAAIARVVAVSLFAALLPWAEAGAPVLDGAYAGTIQCDALPALRALKYFPAICSTMPVTVCSPVQSRTTSMAVPFSASPRSG